MKEQFGGIYWQLQQNVTKPINNTYVRLFRDLLDNVYKIKKFDGSIELFAAGSGIAPNVINTKLIWVNGEAASEGDGSLLNPFKTIQTAIASLDNDVTKAYSILLYPFDYTAADVTIPNLSSVSFRGLGIAAQTSISFNIFDTPAAGKNVVELHDSIAFNGGYTFDGTASGGGVVGFERGAVNYNRLDNNNNLFTLIRGSGISGTRMGGLTIANELILLDDINIPDGANFYTASTVLIDPSKRYVITGTALLKTLGTFNSNIIAPYVRGIANPAVPTWITDFASNAPFDGVVNKQVIGGGVTGTFQDNLGNTVHVTDGLITSFT